MGKRAVAASLRVDILRRHGRAGLSADQNDGAWRAAAYRCSLIPIVEQAEIHVISSRPVRASPVLNSHAGRPQGSDLTPNQPAVSFCR